MLLDADSENFLKLEWLTVIQYDKWSALCSVNKTPSYSFVMRTVNRKAAPYPGCSSPTSGMMYTKQVSGQAVQTLSKHFYLHMTMVG